MHAILPIVEASQTVTTEELRLCQTELVQAIPPEAVTALRNKGVMLTIEHEAPHA